MREKGEERGGKRGKREEGRKGESQWESIGHGVESRDA